MCGNKITNNSSASNYKHFPIPTPTNYRVPVMKTYPLKIDPPSIGVRQNSKPRRAYEFLIRNLAKAPRMPNLQKTHKARSQYGYAANTLLATVDINMRKIKECAILDSGATSHFLVLEAPTTNVQPAINPLIGRLPDGV